MSGSDESLIIEEIRSFLIDRRSRQLSESTLDFYIYHLELFRKACEGRGLASMGDLTAAVLRDIMGDFGLAHNKGGVHALYRTVRALCIWYENESDGAWRNPLRKVAAPKVKLDPIPGVSVEDMRAMVATCTRDWIGKRDRALLLFMFDTGLRRNECLALNLGDIDLDSGTVRVKNGKGGKARVVYFGADTTAELRRYLRGARRPDDSPLWLDIRKKRMSETALRGVLRRRALEAGLKDNPSAHDFRRGFALNMLRNGADVATVSRLLGHESLEVTRRYLALLDEDLERVHNYASPVDRMKDKKAVK